MTEQRAELALESTTLFEPFNKWLAYFERRLRENEPLNEAEGRRLQNLVESAPELGKIADQCVTQNRLRDFVGYQAFEQNLPRILLLSGQKVGIDLSPVVRWFKAWQMFRAGDATESVFGQREALDAKVAWSNFEAVLAPASADEWSRAGIHWQSVSLNDATTDLEKQFETIPKSGQTLDADTIPEAPPADEPQWSKVDSPSEWAKVFGCNSRTFLRWIKSDKIRAKRIDDKNIMVDLRDLPKRDR